MKVQKGQIYRHFKGTLYTVIAVARNTETDELMVIYQNGDKIWARPYEMFTSKVDKEKYPLIEQEYRFELINN